MINSPVLTSTQKAGYREEVAVGLSRSLRLPRSCKNQFFLKASGTSSENYKQKHNNEIEAQIDHVTMTSSLLNKSSKELVFKTCRT